MSISTIDIKALAIIHSIFKTRERRLEEAKSI